MELQVHALTDAFISLVSDLAAKSALAASEREALKIFLDTLAEWKELGETALLRRENWIALCAFHRATQRAPKDPSAWRSLAAVYKRMGYFEEALDAVLKARRLEGTATQ